MRTARTFFASFAFLAGLAGLAPLGAATPPLKPFVDALPLPRRIDAAALPKLDGIPTLHVYERQVKHVFHAQLPPTTVWGYDGELPGPLLEVRSGQALRVYWHNALPDRPLLPIANLAALPGLCGKLPPVRTVVHLHGASVPGDRFNDPARNDDGYPDAWNLPGGTQEALYPNKQEAACLWYHDHAAGVTARNNSAGLAGMYIIRDAYEDSLPLPRGPYEIPLLIRARSFHPDGSIAFPVTATSDEVYGDCTEVNGKLWPYLRVEPRLYRFRILNASTSRSYALKFLGSGGGPGPSLHQIGSDGGFLARPVLLDDPSDPAAPRLVLAPAERADVLVDFSGCAGKTYLLNNNSLTDESSDERPIPDVMQIRVAAVRGPDDGARIPGTLRPIPRLDPAQARRTRRIYFQESRQPGGLQTMLLNGLRWEDPVADRPLLGSVEVWELVNGTGELHPFHVHQVQFQVLGRRAFNRFLYEKFGVVAPAGPWMGPDPGEEGWKDTVRSPPGRLTRIILRFGPYTGRYVYHCHILEHEDMDMMRPFEVVAAADASDPSGTFLRRNPEAPAAGPLDLSEHAPERGLEAQEAGDRGLEIHNPGPGAAGWFGFRAKAGRLLKRRSLAWRYEDSGGGARVSAADAPIQVRSYARRSGAFVVRSTLRERRLRDWQQVLTLSCETAVYGPKGELRFKFQGRGRVEAAPGGAFFVWLPERGDGNSFAVQGPVFLGPSGAVLNDQRTLGQAAASLACQIAFSPDGRWTAVALALPAPRLLVFKGAKLSYQVEGLFSKAVVFDSGDLACIDGPSLVFYKAGAQQARVGMAVEAALARGPWLYALAPSEDENDRSDKEIDLVRFRSDGSGQEALQALRGVKLLDAGVEQEFRVLRSGGDVFIYRFK